MEDNNFNDKLIAQLTQGMKLSKCRKCKCMLDALETMNNYFLKESENTSLKLFEQVNKYLGNMEEIKYNWLGCKFCWGAEIANTFNELYSEESNVNDGYIIETEQETWPPVPGEYFVVNDTKDGNIAVSTLASIRLAEKIFHAKPKGLCIVGKTETENIGIEKVIKNIITNPHIKYLIVTGMESNGHETGQTIIALGKNGIDKNKRIIDSKGKKPILSNISAEEVDVFRKQLEIINMIGCESTEEIFRKINELNTKLKNKVLKINLGTNQVISKIKLSKTEIIQAGEKDPNEVKLDKAGYFVILPSEHKKIIRVEHYSYDNKLLRIIEGKDVRNIYWTIIENGWVTEMSHAAYLGKELTNAEMSIKLGFRYVQDKA